MSDVTQILQQIEGGDPSAAEKLLPLVYEELRKLAAARMVAESPDHTLDATALVHEAYIRLVGGDQPQQWNGRAHFFGAAAEAMRRILVESARRKKSARSAGELNRTHMDDASFSASQSPGLVLDVDNALSRFAVNEPLAAELVKLKFFAGFSLEEAAAVLGIPRSTAYHEWSYARAWLGCALKSRGPD